jgi:hypothetical protein
MVASCLVLFIITNSVVCCQMTRITVVVVDIIAAETNEKQPYIMCIYAFMTCVCLNASNDVLHYEDTGEGVCIQCRYSSNNNTTLTTTNNSSSNNNNCNNNCNNSCNNSNSTPTNTTRLAASGKLSFKGWRGEVIFERSPSKDFTAGVRTNDMASGHAKTTLCKSV